VTSSHLPEAIDGQEILLIDDVIHSGRTTRAAMNEIFSFGRPARIILATLIDRCERELPIQADIVAKTLRLRSDQTVKLRSTDNRLSLKIITTPNHDQDTPSR
jgi:pyrimidine operon attenuation protein/uracil phosphoribosyltransferase